MGLRSTKLLIFAIVFTVLLALCLLLWVAGFIAGERLEDDDDGIAQAHIARMYLICGFLTTAGTIISLWIVVFLAPFRRIATYLHMSCILLVFVSVISAFVTYESVVLIDDCGDLPDDQEDHCHGDKTIISACFFYFAVLAALVPFGIYLLIDNKPDNLGGDQGERQTLTT